MKNYREIFEGRAALVTGAGKRLGRAIAFALSEHGCSVAIQYNTSRDEAEKVVGEIRARGGKAWGLHADLNDAKQAEGLLLRAVEAAGPLDFLVNNASSYEKSSLDSFTMEEFTSTMQLNTYAPVQLCRAFAEQRRKGAILNMLDTLIHSYDREHVTYHLSKRMLYAFTRIFAWECAPHIRVNGIAPGIILPPKGEGREWLEKLRHTNPLDTYGTVEDITDAALFLFASEFITGEVIHIDGGRHLKNRFYAG